MPHRDARESKPFEWAAFASHEAVSYLMFA
jgi:hypothetical protein